MCVHERRSSLNRVSQMGLVKSFAATHECSFRMRWFSPTWQCRRRTRAAESKAIEMPNTAESLLAPNNSHFQGMDASRACDAGPYAVIYGSLILSYLTVT